MAGQPPELTAEIYSLAVRRYRALAAYLAEAIGSLIESEHDWGFGVDQLNPEAQYRWLEEIRELQRERTALEDLIIAGARAQLPYRSIPSPGPGEGEA
jgi:predicted DNA-binding protein